MNRSTTSAAVIPFLRKRAERARARYCRLDSSERTEAEVQNHVFAVMDYAYEHYRKSTTGKPRRPTEEEFTEILSRLEEITGPAVPLSPDFEELVQCLARNPQAPLDSTKRDGGDS